LAASACGGSSHPIHGGSGVVTAGRIGSLQIDVSTQAAVVAFAGKPDATETSQLSWPHVPSYRALGYRCGGGMGLAGTDHCQTVYYLNMRTHRLAAFSTGSRAFHTATGIFPGMRQNAADRREHQTPHGAWNAIGESSPSADLVLPSTCAGVKNGRCSGAVEDFLLESRHHPIGFLFT
jgi:hypothetical protein